MMQRPMQSPLLILIRRFGRPRWYFNHVPETIGCRHTLTGWRRRILPSVTNLTLRCYSTNDETAAHTKFITEYLKRASTKIAEENIKLLDKEKCEIYEILEWPHVLDLKYEDIQERILYLKERNFPISVGHLKCVQGTTNHNFFRQLLNKYHKTTHGHRSIGEVLVERYGVDRNEVMTVLSNPRIPPSKIIAKIDLLSEYGYEAKEIVLDTALMMVSETELLRRCEDLTELGIATPARKYLTMTKKMYKARISNLRNSNSEDHRVKAEQTTKSPSLQEDNEMVSDAKSGGENLNILMDESCHSYEVFEWPEILQLDAKVLKKCISYLKTYDIPVSVGHLKCVHNITSHKKFLGKIANYHKHTQGHPSLGDCLIHNHGYSRERAVELLEEYPDMLWSKFFLLRKYGIDEDELDYRCKYLLSHGMTSLVFSDLLVGKSRASFESVVRERTSQNSKTIAEILKTTLKHLRNTAGKLPKHSLTSVRFLTTERNYSTDEVLRHIELIKLTVEQLKLSFAKLERTVTARPIPLEAVLSYNTLSHGKDRTPVFTGLVYAKSLLLTTKNMDSFVNECVPKVTNLSTKDIELNYYFLLNECNLSQSDIGLLPVILLHYPAALRKHWRTVVEETEPEVLEDLCKNPERLLNLLQYYLEKSTNFRQIYVLDDQGATDQPIGATNSGGTNISAQTVPNTNDGTSGISTNLV